MKSLRWCMGIGLLMAAVLLGGCGGGSDGDETIGDVSLRDHIAGDQADADTLVLEGNHVIWGRGEADGPVVVLGHLVAAADGTLTGNWERFSADGIDATSLEGEYSLDADGTGAVTLSLNTDGAESQRQLALTLTDARGGYLLEASGERALRLQFERQVGELALERFSGTQIMRLTSGDVHVLGDVQADAEGVVTGGSIDQAVGGTLDAGYPIDGGQYRLTSGHGRTVLTLNTAAGREQLVLYPLSDSRVLAAMTRPDQAPLLGNIWRQARGMRLDTEAAAGRHGLVAEAPQLVALGLLETNVMGSVHDGSLTINTTVRKGSRLPVSGTLELDAAGTGAMELDAGAFAVSATLRLVDDGRTLFLFVDNGQPVSGALLRRPREVFSNQDVAGPYVFALDSRRDGVTDLAAGTASADGRGVLESLEGQSARRSESGVENVSLSTSGAYDLGRDGSGTASLFGRSDQMSALLLGNGALRLLALDEGEQQSLHLTPRDR